MNPIASTHRRQKSSYLIAAALGAGLWAVAWTTQPTRGDDGPSARAADRRSKAKGKSSDALTKQWKVLHAPGQSKAQIAPLPKNSPLEVWNNFEIVGPRPGDPFLFGNFKSQGEWAIVNDAIKPVDGKHTACRLARAEDFELEGLFNAEGLGGWFFLVGWNRGEGYMIYNVKNVSGSPWLVCEFHESKGIEETHRELYRYEWKGVQPLRMIVAEQQLNLQVGRESIIKDLPLPGYRGGDVIVGTYDTRYGPRPLSIHSLRMRAR